MNSAVAAFQRLRQVRQTMVRITREEPKYVQEESWIEHVGTFCKVRRYWGQAS